MPRRVVAKDPLLAALRRSADNFGAMDRVTTQDLVVELGPDLTIELLRRYEETRKALLDYTKSVVRRVSKDAASLVDDPEPEAWPRLLAATDTELLFRWGALRDAESLDQLAEKLKSAISNLPRRVRYNWLNVVTPYIVLKGGDPEPFLTHWADKPSQTLASEAYDSIAVPAVDKETWEAALVEYVRDHPTETCPASLVYGEPWTNFVEMLARSFSQIELPVTLPQVHKDPVSARALGYTNSLAVRATSGAPLDFFRRWFREHPKVVTTLIPDATEEEARALAEWPGLDPTAVIQILDRSTGEPIDARWATPLTDQQKKYITVLLWAYRLKNGRPTRLPLELALSARALATQWGRAAPPVPRAPEWVARPTHRLPLAVSQTFYV